MTILLVLMALASLDVPKSVDYPTVWKVIQHEGRMGRVMFEIDPILLNMAENPNFIPSWEETATADENGTVKHQFFRNGWAYSEYESDENKAILLEGTGFNSLFVNGERFVGDYYSNGILRIPIPLKRGINHFLVRVVRSGEFRIKLNPAVGSCSISPYDSILPDMREDALLDSCGAVVILNHTDQTINVKVEAGDSQVFEKTSSDASLIPYGLTKPAFHLKQLRQPRPDELQENVYKLPITLHNDQINQTIYLPMSISKSGQPYKETKLSGIDGSVQYYAVRPPISFDPQKSYALYFTLHGAAVEATGQIGAYTSKADGFIVAPTNRRPYGFDWQEWGRLDALETLDMFTANHRIDPEHIYLTGHSMGGHGTWYLGALYPSRFGAIGPSAGWISFSSYTERRRNTEEKDDERLLPFKWAQMENDTLALIENYTNLPIYVLHGEKDDNVPVEQSRQMVAELEKFHKDFVYHEQPGAGHWWGSDCVDWTPMFEFFRKHVKPLYPLSIKFKTPNPAISGSYAWVTIQSQILPSDFSSITADAEPKTGTVKISTSNIERLMLDLREVLPQAEAKIEIDGANLSASTGSPVYLLKTSDNGWNIVDPPSSWSKNPKRNGPFKLAFDKYMVWVYGTYGSDEENKAILAKVRYDAQNWWYRGNGNVVIVPDREFDPEKFAGCNVILYGNSDINSVFKSLLKDCPIQVDRNEVRIGQKSYQGDASVLFVYPRTGSDENLVGIIGMTTLKSVRVNYQASYFTSGVTCPDYVIFSPETLSNGMSGVLDAGYFDNQWGLKTE